MLFAARRLPAWFLLLLIGFSASAQVAPETRPAETPPSRQASPAGPRISFNYVNVDGTYIAMTFDDGPQEKLTPELLDLLAKHRIKATFFVIGENAAEYRTL